MPFALVGLAALLVPVLLAAPAAAADPGQTCVRSGTITLCEGGRQFQTFGNTTIDDRGRVWRHVEEFSFSSTGETVQRLPGETFDPDPSAWPPYGSEVFDPEKPLGER